MVAYAILDTPGKGKALRANQYIARGSLIIAEAPLLTVSVGTYELYDDQAYFEPGERSGGPGIYRQFLKLPRKVQSAYNSLHYITKSDEELEAAKGGRKNALTREEWECLSRLRKNSFDGRVDFDSPAEVMQHVVFNHISRINHSCTPNAVWKWDPDLGQGVVHALREVLKHEEITISYLQDPENILLSRDQRREYIRTNFEFDCRCDCCESHETAKDDEARHTALLAYNYLLLLTGAEGEASIPNPPLPILRHRKICRTDSGHNYHLRMKHVLEQTIALFKQANIADTNLSALYNLQATYYENLFAITDGSVNEQACHKCGLLLHRREYLDLALRALDDVIHNDTICFGAGHREVRMVTQRRLELQKRRAGCNSPRLS